MRTSQTNKSQLVHHGVENEKANINTKDRRAMDLAFDIDYGDIPGAHLRSPKENLGAAARSTLNLVKILVEDLGFDHSDMNITFSGKKGFHVRVAKTSTHCFLTVRRKTSQLEKH